MVKLQCELVRRGSKCVASVNHRPACLKLHCDTHLIECTASNQFSQKIACVVLEILSFFLLVDQYWYGQIDTIALTKSMPKTEKVVVSLTVAPGLELCALSAADEE